ncbi:MAG: autotransporter-associated beta strand repeat-containing protein [Planctomycetota bacterium]|nr:autotransporter-associated beta strand repeat-containing protein [Planctomycetota bacterium]
MRRMPASLLGLSAWLFAVTTATATTTTQFVLSPDQPTAAAIAEDPTLADRTTFDLVITTTADWTNSSLKFALSDGSFYNAADGGDVPTTPGLWSFPGLRHLRQDTFVAAPPDFRAPLLIIGSHPSDGGGSAIFSASTVSVLWADNSTTYGPGTYTVARLTVSNDAVGSFFGSAFDSSLPGTAQPFNGAINKQLRWDTDPLTSGAQGGTGTWNTTSNGFWNGAANVAWNNGWNDVAIFGAQGGTVTVGSVTASALRFDTAGYALTGGTIALAGSGRVTANQDAAIHSTVVSAAGLNKRGAATLILSGDNTYSGGTTVSEGALLVNNITGSGTGSGAVTVGAATLGGTGFISGPVTLTGDSTLTSTAALTINSTLTVWGAANQLSAGTIWTAGDVTIEPDAVFIVNGTLGGGTSNLIVYGTLMGKGTINKMCIIEAGGVISPGAPSSIVTLPQVLNAAAPRNFSFEIDGPGPNYAAPRSSVNDVLRLTNEAMPFANAAGDAPARLTPDTVIDVYFLFSEPPEGQYKAEFFAETDFADAISDATLRYWRLDPRGSLLYNGNFFSPLDASMVDWSVVPETAAFADGNISGYITQFTVAPEPGTLALAALGVLMTLPRSRRRAEESPDHRTRRR